MQRLTLNEAATKLARLYGDLDYAHGFYEGNSRALREFTRTLAAEAGLRLDWSVTLVSAVQRNALYAARDLEVIARHYPGMTPNTATTPREHYATIQAENFRKTLGEHPLEDIIRAGLTPLAALKLAINDHRKTADTPAVKIADYWTKQMTKAETKPSIPDLSYNRAPSRGRKL